MTSLIKFELGKILRNRTVFGGIVVGCLVLLGIFFVGYHYSQLSMSEASNKKKGFEKSLDVIIDEKYSGEFTDEKVKMILSDSMNNFQENEEKKVVNKPFYPFYWEMGDTFFSKDAENVYSEMIEQVNKGQRLTIEREYISPSEKAHAYKMRYDVMKKKGNTNVRGRVVHKTKGKRTVEILAEEFGESTKYDILILFLIFFDCIYRNT